MIPSAWNLFWTMTSHGQFHCSFCSSSANANRPSISLLTAKVYEKTWFTWSFPPLYLRISFLLKLFLRIRTLVWRNTLSIKGWGLTWESMEKLSEHPLTSTLSKPPLFPNPPINQTWDNVVYFDQVWSKSDEYQPNASTGNMFKNSLWKSLVVKQNSFLPFTPFICESFKNGHKCLIIWSTFIPIG